MVSPDTLRSFPWFKWASADALSTLSMVSDREKFEAGAELFREGEPADYIYVLTAGSVDVFYTSDSGERHLVDSLSEGDLLVWSAVVEPYVLTATGVARTDCEVVALDAERLRQLIREDSELGSGLMVELVKVTAKRLKGARARLVGPR